MTYQKALTALANPTRALIFDLLRRGPATVGEVARQVPVTRAAVSQHFKLLMDAGLVSNWFKGRQHYFQIDVQGLRELRAWLEQFPEGTMKSPAVRPHRRRG